MFRTRKMIKELRELIAALRDSIGRDNEKLREAEQTIRLDYICGHWLSQIREHKITIYKSSQGGYMLVVVYRGKVWKRLPIRVIDGRLIFTDPKGRDVEIEHSMPLPIIHLGSFGQYHREDLTHEILNP